MFNTVAEELFYSMLIFLMNMQFLRCCFGIRFTYFRLSERFINEEGYPITMSSEEQEKIKQDWNSPVSMRLPVSLMEEGFGIIQNFHKVDSV